MIVAVCAVLLVIVIVLLLILLNNNPCIMTHIILVLLMFVYLLTFTVIGVGGKYPFIILGPIMLLIIYSVPVAFILYIRRK